MSQGILAGLPCWLMWYTPIRIQHSDWVLEPGTLDWRTWLVLGPQHNTVQIYDCFWHCCTPWASPCETSEGCLGIFNGLAPAILEQMAFDRLDGLKCFLWTTALLQFWRSSDAESPWLRSWIEDWMSGSYKSGREPFLATLVALHFTPVSQLVSGHSFRQA